MVDIHDSHFREMDRHYLLTISKLLGHSSFITTMIYLHVRRQHFERSPSPIDWLPVRQCHNVTRTFVWKALMY